MWEETDGEENAGKEVDPCTKTEQDLGNGIDYKVAGVEFHW